MSAKIKIGDRIIGDCEPTYIIAEMSANHNQDFDQAAEIVRAAKKAGADAVKLQTYTADTITLDCDSELFQIKGTIWSGRNLYDLYGEAYTPWEWQPRLKKLANELGLDCFSSPFDGTAVDFLEKMQVPAYKIASFELVDIPLIERVARTGKPTIISTGMGSLADIDDAVRAFRNAGGSELALLKCTSAYPSPPQEMNLRTITHLGAAFSVPVGLSDHTLGISIPVAAVAAGACIIEKHFTLSRSQPGPDSAFSLEPMEFAAMVAAIRQTEQALGSINYSPTAKELAGRAFRRSLFVAKDISAGTAFTAENVRSIRPAGGLLPVHLPAVLRGRANMDLKKGTPLTWAMVSDAGSGHTG
jgi:pseudaminic acid synthase